MKAFTIVMKILAAAAAIVGAVYVAATYGDKIVAWAKKMLKCPCCEETEEAPVEVEAAEEEAPVVEEEIVEEEAPVVEEAPAEEEAPVADEADFEG